MERIEIAGPTDRIGHAEAQTLVYREAALGEKLGPLWATYWVRVEAQVPESWAGERVDLHWDSRSEALLRVDRRSIAGFNIGRRTAPLIDQARGGERIRFEMEVACNRLFGDSDDPSRPRSTRPYELAECALLRFDPEAWTLHHDFETLRRLEADREPPQTTRAFGAAADRVTRPALDPSWSGKLLHRLNDFCNLVDPEDRSTWSAGRPVLAALLAARNGTVAHEVSAVGHAHIDTAWLWPLDETRRKCQRSFATAIMLMDRYPDFIFACSQAYQYEIIERTDPELFARIAEKVRAGQWVPVGGSWIEPDCNLPSGEAMCRQFLYGQRWFESRFGRRCTLFWNPDVFGYDGQLPQILREAGIDRFLTQKLSWNRFTTPPHHSFHWRGIDGSSVLTHFPPADTYGAFGTVEELRYHSANYKDADRSSHALYLFGHGDGGGGATPEMIEVMRRTADLQGVPRVVMRDPHEFFDRLAAEGDGLATIEGELYFEYHRGTYTSQAEAKRLNRRGQDRLVDLDLLCVAAATDGRSVPSRERVEELWQTLLTNQFHDILPGSSIGEVHARNRADMGALVEEAETIGRELLGGVGPMPVNPLGTARAEIADGPDGVPVWVEAEPFSIGRTGGATDTVRLIEQAEGWRLENAHLSALIGRDGALRSLIERTTGREAMEEAGRILLLDDRPLDFDAWDIDPFALETARNAGPADACTVTLQGPLRAELRVERRIGKASRMEQRVRLDAGAPRLEFRTVLDWAERHLLVKAEFPLALRARNATYETMYGVAERPTHANTDADLAQYEVPGQRWADLSEPGFGVALLSDARHGFACFDGRLSLSLVRGSTYPDREADIGVHRFAYALMPHADGWREADIILEAARFSRPMLWAANPPPSLARPLVACERRGVVIDAVKPAENGEGWLVRLYEAHGGRGAARLRFARAPIDVWRSNTLEDRLQRLEVTGDTLELDLRPFQLVTLRVE